MRDHESSTHGYVGSDEILNSTEIVDRPSASSRTKDMGARQLVCPTD